MLPIELLSHPVLLSPNVLLSHSEVMKYGRYRGFTSLGIVFQTMDNTHLRRALGMKGHQTGVLLNRIQPTTSTAKVRQEGFFGQFECGLVAIGCVLVALWFKGWRAHVPLCGE